MGSNYFCKNNTAKIDGIIFVKVYLNKHSKSMQYLFAKHHVQNLQTFVKTTNFYKQKGGLNEKNSWICKSKQPRAKS